MAWNGDFSYLDYRDIDKRTIAQFSETWSAWGDQGYINTYLKTVPELTNELFPDRFVSYKWGVRRQGFVPKDASIICFHGKPRPSDINWSLPDNGH
jgi:hypothetical protein